MEQEEPMKKLEDLAVSEIMELKLAIDGVYGGREFDKAAGKGIFQLVSLPKQNLLYLNLSSLNPCVYPKNYDVL